MRPPGRIFALLICPGEYTLAMLTGILLALVLLIIGLGIGRLSLWILLYALTYRVWLSILTPEVQMSLFGKMLEGWLYYLVFVGLTLVTMSTIATLTVNFPFPHLLTVIIVVLAWYVLVYKGYPLAEVLFLKGFWEWVKDLGVRFSEWFRDLSEGSEGEHWVMRLYYFILALGAAIGSWVDAIFDRLFG